MTALVRTLHSGIGIDSLATLTNEHLGACTMLVETPSSYTILRHEPSRPAPLPADAYAVRAFSDAGEVRWQLTGGDTGEAVVAVLVDDHTVAGAVVLRGEAIERSYFIWGQVLATNDGSVTVGNDRIRPIVIPSASIEGEATRGNTLVLTARECVTSVDDADGNCHVVDEVLTAIKVQEMQK